MKSRSLIAVGLLAIALLAFAPTVQATVFYSNPYSSSSTDAWSSFYQPEDNPYFQSYADYYYDGSFEMTDFHWWGGPYDYNTDIDHFVFQIYDHDGSASRPGSLLYEQSVAGDAGASYVESRPDLSLDIYSYSLYLDTPFMPVSPGYYWFSIYAVGDGDLSNWFWAQGSGYHFNNDVQYWYGDQYWNEDMEADFAFELTGCDTVPEPATLSLFGLGLVGLAFRRRKK